MNIFKTAVRMVIALTLLSFYSLASAQSQTTIAQPETTFDKIVFFGDSLSDDGNLYSADFKLLPKDPPYFKGRFSNGHIWSDVTAKFFTEEYDMETTNYAYGGETAMFHSPTGGFLPYDLAMSRNSYIIHTLFQDRTHTLFIIWIGANDYIPSEEPNVEQITTDVVDSIRGNIESLIAHGGLSFIIINLPDIAKTPGAKEAGREVLMDQLTRAHNRKLADMVETLQMQYRTVHIQLYDINSMFDDLIVNTDYYNQKYHLTISNKTESCWGGGYRLQRPGLQRSVIANDFKATLQHEIMQPNASAEHFNVDGFASFVAQSPDLAEAYRVGQLAQDNQKPCDKPEDYIFWDHIHPTTTIHAIMADGMIQFIKRNYLPIA